MPNDNEKEKTIAQVLVMISKNYLMEEGTLSKKDTVSENFIKNLKKMYLTKNLKKRCLLKKPNQEHKKKLYQKKKKNSIKNLIKNLKKVPYQKTLTQESKKVPYQKTPYQEAEKNPLIIRFHQKSKSVSYEKRVTYQKALTRILKRCLIKEPNQESKK